jgi:topoisomerase IV subunit B
MPAEPVRRQAGEAKARLPNGRCAGCPKAKLPQESYVNLIPTAQGGTHVNGLRSGLTEAMREFCDFRNLLPRGVKLAPEDVWDRASYVLSIKMGDPQFSGQTKERLSSRQAAAFVEGAAHDVLAVAEPARRAWARRSPSSRSPTRRTRDEDREAGRPQEDHQAGLPCPASWPTAPAGSRPHRALPGRGRLGRRQAKQARDKDFQAILPLRGKILNTWEVESRRSAGLAGSARHHRRHRRAIPATKDIEGCATARSASSPTPTRTACTSPPALRAVPAHFRPLVRAGHVFVAMPPLFRVDVGKQVFYALDEAERNGILERIRTSENPRAPSRRHCASRASAR